MKLRGFVGALLIVQGCGQLMSGASEPMPAVLVNTPTSVPTATVPPTPIPGSAADREDLAVVVRQFGDAVAMDQELVALLTLSPSARRVAAASGLNRFLGRPAMLESLEVGTIRLDDDVAFVRCIAHYANDDVELQLRLVRLDGGWKIDGRVE